MLEKLEKSKDALTRDVTEIEISTRDNSLNIERLNDQETSKKNNCKVRLKDFQNEVHENIACATSSMVAKSDHALTMKTINSKLQSLDQKVNCENGSPKFEKNISLICC